MKRLSIRRAALATTMLAGLACFSMSAGAQTLNERLAQRSSEQNGKKDRLLVQANTLVYNRTANTVAASGAVQLYYQGRVLEADRVTYDRATSRVYAEGHGKLIDRDGSVLYSERFELTDDFKDGFIDSLTLDTADHAHFTAARAERIGGETTVFERGLYSACQSCRDDPERPPLWQVRAKRIIHNNDEQTIYYEDADLELLGTPIAYLPYFSTPDPSVRRRSGFLTPHYMTKSELGFGLAVPYFWALAPNYDLTLTPTILSRQGFLGDVEWRHRLLNGAYNIRVAGIFEADPTAFSVPPYGSGNKRARGSLQTAGQFWLNQQWKYGWDITLLSDKWFLQDYNLPNDKLSANYFRESTSTIYLNGQSGRGYFDLRGYYFQGQSRHDLQSQQPFVAPQLDYNKAIDLSPDQTMGIGGQLTLDLNATSLARPLASYEAIGPYTLDRAYGLYEVCETYDPIKKVYVRTYNRTSCLVRGIGGDYTRVTAQATWQRKYIDAIGEVWTPFAFARLNGSFLRLKDTGAATFSSSAGTSVIANLDQNAFFGTPNSTFRGSVTPGVGVDYRFPFIGSTPWGTQVLEPIVQIVARPNEATSQGLVNEDSQSLVFDDTNLFEWNRFSGYDRFEGGTRVNYGAQYTMTFAKSGYFNALVGQSYQIAGRNSYASADAANIGLSSGLDTRRSDYVSRIALAPSSNLSFIAKARFDESTFAMRRLDLMSHASWGPLEVGLQYARYQAQPLLGYDKRREGLAASTKYAINQNYYVTGNVIFDLSRHLYNKDLGISAPLFSTAGLGVGAGYTDDCTTFSVNYTSVYQDNGTGGPVRNQTVLFQLQLKTFGDGATAKADTNALKVQDGISRP